MSGIYRSRQVSGAWSTPERVWLNDDLSLDGCPTLWGTTLWFCSARAGGLRVLDMYTAERRGERFEGWTSVGQTLSQQYELGELHLTAGGDEIYFDSSRAGGKGKKDLWVTRRVGGQWQPPVPVEALNTEGDEGWPFVSEDGNELWFTRMMGSPAILRSIKVAGAWQAPEIVPSPLAGEPTLDRQGNLYFVHHYFDDAKGQLLEADLYFCRRR